LVRVAVTVISGSYQSVHEASAGALLAITAKAVLETFIVVIVIRSWQSGC
jgi:hypothetical protein